MGRVHESGHRSARLFARLLLLLLKTVLEVGGGHLRRRLRGRLGGRRTGAGARLHQVDLGGVPLEGQVLGIRTLAVNFVADLDFSAFDHTLDQSRVWCILFGLFINFTKV